MYNLPFADEVKEVTLSLFQPSASDKGKKVATLLTSLNATSPVPETLFT